jgi:hypothetical protein
MAAYSFKKQFVDPIRAGIKHHTIRADRKDGRVPKIGEPLSLYCGMRTKGCFKILSDNPPCRRVERIVIRECGRCGGTGEIACSSTHYESCPAIEVIVAGQRLAKDECEQLARADGFPDFSRMMKFWEGRLPFEGNIIHWR